MIGGYLHSERDDNFHARLQGKLDPKWQQIKVWKHGYFFCTDPFQSDRKSFSANGEWIALSEDLLVARDGSGTYRPMDLQSDFAVGFAGDGARAFDSIQSDFRMAVATSRGSEYRLFLASNRAGSGRIYYHRLKNGIVFCSDLRFLLKIVPFEVNRKAIYAILKYGSTPEPLTICKGVSAVPAAHYLQYDIANGNETLTPYFKYEFPGDRQTGEFDEKRSLGAVREILRNSAKFLESHTTSMLLSGGIDSSLYGCYLNQEKTGALQGFYCSFGQDDPEYRYACAIAERLGVSLQVATMGKSDAMRALDEVVRLTDHPFSDFSSLPIVFLLQYIREHQNRDAMIIECNGGDDCFGFPALLDERKYRMKHSFPGILKKGIAKALANSTYWKWESSEGIMARVAALADVHERSHLNYFLSQAPVNYLSLDRHADWDDSLQEIIERTAANCAQDPNSLGYEAKTTIRQLLYINSARWAAKALSVGESLGTRVVYPYIWRDVLVEQGKLPWNAKVHEGIVKWPLKRLLEEFMPADFIYRPKSGFVPPFVRWLTDPEFNDKVRGILLSSKAYIPEVIPSRILEELLTDARQGRRLRFPILNMLWGAIFTESWIQSLRSARPPF
jgi:asparagine synthase (glutamine-hydrolysing)